MVPEFVPRVEGGRHPVCPPKPADIWNALLGILVGGGGGGSLNNIKC